MNVSNTKFRGNLLSWSRAETRGPVDKGTDGARTWRSSQAPLAATRTHLFVCFWRDSPQWARVSSFTRFLDHTQRRTTFGRTPLDEWSARRRDLYLTTLNTHNRQKAMPPVGFEPTISAGERLKTYSLDRAATGTGENLSNKTKIRAVFLKYPPDPQAIRIPSYIQYLVSLFSVRN